MVRTDAKKLLLSAKEFFASKRLVAASLVLNAILVSTLFYLWKTHATHSVTDPSILISQNQAVLDSLQQQLSALRDQHRKNFEEYNRQMSMITDDYNARIAALETEKLNRAKKIVESHKGDIAGLAVDFSQTMNIKLGK